VGASSSNPPRHRALRAAHPADTLVVHALEATSVLDTHNVIEFEIRGHLWSQPVPLEVLLRTHIDLEAGQVEVRDASSVPTPRVR
jgi:type VI secretion system protein ImpF